MRKVLLVGAALLAFSLTGCDIYFGPNSDSDCGVFEPCDDRVWPDEPPPGTPGGECGSDYDCNAGCFCEFQNDDGSDSATGQTGTCVETGFCESAGDCPIDFTCQIDRATCAPDSLEPPPPPTDCATSGCPDGMACDGLTGECVPSTSCVVDSDCGAGFECDANGTCQPMSCAADGDCLDGCACDTDSGICEETGFCLEDADCVDFCDPATGDCQPTVCDQARGTCTFDMPGSTTCGAPLICAQPAPACATGESAEVVDGCYTGACVATEECIDAPLATCDRIQNPNQCINRPDCDPDYEGMNCTCGGQTCDCANPPVDSSGQPLECTCEIWVYSCDSI